MLGRTDIECPFVERENDIRAAVRSMTCERSLNGVAGTQTLIKSGHPISFPLFRKKIENLVRDTAFFLHMLNQY